MAFMRVFLTGATGYIGTAVLDALLRASHEVTALVRSSGAAEKVARRGARPVTGELGRPETYREAAAGHDAYIHAAYDGSPRGPDLELQTVDSLVALASAVGVSALIYTSGVWVLGSTPEPVAEDAPLDPPKLVAWRPAVEERVLAASGPGLRTVVVRPGLVYGGARGLISELLTSADNGLMRVIGKGENHWAVVYDRDLADLYVRLLASPTASGIFHATDESDETVHDIVEAIAGQAPARPDVRYMPLAEARRKRGALADALVLDQLVRSPRARALGWAPSLGTMTRNIPRLYEEWRNARNEERA
jgi:nucleoside-diphosphate-sugar epimerase